MEDLMKNIRNMTMGVVVALVCQAPVCAMQGAASTLGKGLAKVAGIAGVGAGAGAYAHDRITKSPTFKRLFAQPVARPSVPPVVVRPAAPVSLFDRLKQQLPTSESIKAKIIEKGPAVLAKTAALAGTGAAGYAAASLASRGTLEKCSVVAAGLALGAGSALTLGAQRTAALGAAFAMGWITHNRTDITELIRKWSAGEDAPAHRGTQFDRWEINQWPTAKDLRDNEGAVIAQLRTDIADANGSFQIEHQPELHQRVQVLDGQVTWRDVLHYIQLDLAEVRRDRKYLEDKYLTYFNLWPSVYPAFGIKRRYSDLCKSAGVTEITPGEFQDAHYWTPGQVTALRGHLPEELYAPQSLIGKALQYLFKPNFGTAAQLWWHLKNIQCRLEELERFVKKLGANTVAAPLPPYCDCGRWAQPNARGCHHEQVGNPAGFCQQCAGTNNPHNNIPANVCQHCRAVLNANACPLCHNH